MALPGFDAHDLRSTHMKFCTSAPFDAALKADVLKRRARLRGGTRRSLRAASWRSTGDSETAWQAVAGVGGLRIAMRDESG